MHLQAGQCGNQIGAKVGIDFIFGLIHYIVDLGKADTRGFDSPSI